MAKNYKIPSGYTKEEWDSLSKREKIKVRSRAYRELPETQHKDYEAYLRRWHKQAESMGGSENMADPNPYTEKQFLTMRTIQYNELAKEKRAGRRKSIGNVIQYLVRNQAYDVSYLQAEAIGNYMKKHNKDKLMKAGFLVEKEMTRIEKRKKRVKGQWVEYEVEVKKNELRFTRKGLHQLRTGELQEKMKTYTSMSDMYHEEKKSLIESGMSSHEAVLKAKDLITKTFFYPDEEDVE